MLAAKFKFSQLPCDHQLLKKFCTSYLKVLDEMIANLLHKGGLVKCHQEEKLEVLPRNHKTL